MRSFKPFLFVICILVSNRVFSQLSFYQDTVTKVNVLNNGFSVHLADTIFNNSSSTVNLTWQKVYEYNSSNWNLQSFCDNEICYLNNSMIHNLSIPAGHYGYIYPTVKANENTSGCIAIVIKVSWSEHVKFLHYIFSMDSTIENCIYNFSPSLSIEEVQEEKTEEIYIYPNPVSKFITIENKNILYFELYNSLGENLNLDMHSN